MPNTSSVKLSEFFLSYDPKLNHDISFISVMPRRGSNSLELLVNKNPKIADKYKTYLTENGLLMQAEDISKQYLTDGVFPQIKLYDDMLVHGRSLNRFLQNFYELICEYLKRQNVEVELGKLREDFCKAITLYVCSVNNAPILLNHEFQWRIHYKELCSESVWRERSRGISNEIWESDIANTSYILSARIQASSLELPKKSEMWDENESSYCGKKQKLYLYKELLGDGAFPTVRSYECGEHLYFTPYFFMPSFTLKQAQDLVSDLSGYLRQQENVQLDALVKLMQRAGEFKQRYGVYCQFINLLLAQITLQYFLKSFDLPAGSVEFDTKKIARNFGPAEEVRKMLDELCKVQWPEDYLRKLFQKTLLSESRVIWGRTRDTVHDDEICDAVEMVIYEQAVKHEKHAREMEAVYAAGRVVSIDTLDSTGEIEINAFLKQVFQYEEKILPDIHFIMTALSHLMQMMDRGDVSLKARVKPVDETSFAFSSMVRCTEMSLSILPQKLAPYYDSVFRLAQYFWMDDEFPKQIRCFFDDVLAEHDGTAKAYTKWAVKFAEVIRSNRSIFESIINWKKIVKSF